MDKENVRIVVLGKNYSTALSIVRALGQAGYNVSLFYVVTNNKAYSVVESSKYVSHSYILFEKDDRKILKALLEQYCAPETTYILFPTDDYTSMLINQHSSELRKHFLMPYVDGYEDGIISQYMDKSFQMESAEKFHLNTAKSWTIDINTDVFDIPDDIEYPCFCKPLVSANGRKSEIGSCCTKEELLEYLDGLTKWKKDRSVMVQKLLDIDEEFSISGVCLKEQIILPALLKKLRVAEFDKGVTLMGRIDGFEAVDDEVICKLKEMLTSLRYIGMVDIELIRCGKKIYFNEINFRCSGVNYAVTVAGCNLPELFVDHLLGGKRSSDPIQIKYGLKFLSEKAAWDDYINGRMSKKELKHTIQDADFTLIDDADDTRPIKEFNKAMRKSFLRKRVGKLLPVKLKEIIKGCLQR